MEKGSDDCGLCKQNITTRGQGEDEVEESRATVKFPKCGHVVHLSCFLETPNFLFYVRQCKVCLLSLFFESNCSKVEDQARSKKNPFAAGLGIPYPPPTSTSRDTLRYLSGSTNTTHKGSSINGQSTSLTTMGNSLTDTQQFIALARASLQDHYSGYSVLTKKEMVKDHEMARAFSIASFIDAINSEHHGTVKVLLGEGNPTTLNIAPKISGDINHHQSKKGTGGAHTKDVAVPYSVHGTQTWIVTRGKVSRTILAKLMQGEYVAFSKLIRKGFRVLDLVQSGIMLSDLIERNRYTLKELVDYGMMWEGMVALGLDLSYFRKKDVYPIRSFMGVYPWLSIYHILILEPSNLSPSEKMDLFCALKLPAVDLHQLGFSIPEMAPLLSKASFILLTQTYSFDDLVTKMGLNGGILKGKGLLDAKFFRDMGWMLPTHEIADRLRINKSEINDSELQLHLSQRKTASFLSSPNIRSESIVDHRNTQQYSIGRQSMRKEYYRPPSTGFGTTPRNGPTDIYGGLDEIMGKPGICLGNTSFGERDTKRRHKPPPK
jgi:hypothetical protein